MENEAYSSVLHGLRGINMNIRERARAEAGVRASAMIVELFTGIAGLVGLRSKQAQQA